MKQQINEIKRMQQLAGVLKESLLKENEEAKKAYEDSFEWAKKVNDWSNAITGLGPNGRNTGGIDLYKNNPDLKKLFDDFRDAQVNLLKRLYELSRESK